MGNQLKDALKLTGILDTLKAEREKKRPVVQASSETSQEPRNNPNHPNKNQYSNYAGNIPAKVFRIGGNLNRPASDVQKGPRPTLKPVFRILDVPASAPDPKPVSRLVRVGSFHRHPLFYDDLIHATEMPTLKFTGIEQDLTNGTPATDETNLVIGLDFGTSATKVVIRDCLAELAFVVRFNPSIQGVEANLIPSRVFRAGELYSLMKGGIHISNLKMGLLTAAKDGKEGIQEFKDCCAFLALVIRRAKAWFFTEYHDRYKNHKLNWGINLGLAARSYEEKEVVELFRRLAWAAANLASDPVYPYITDEAVDTHIELSQLVTSEGDKPIDNGMAFRLADIDVVPEVSAQLQGFMESARWDWNSRPIMLLVDIGAGTVDSAIFHVNAPPNSSGKLSFYSSRVELNGVMFLHRDRVDWLRAILPADAGDNEARQYLDSIREAMDRMRPIPQTVREYLPGYEVEVAGEDSDAIFFRNRYRYQVSSNITEAITNKGLPTHQLQNIPLLLCGGGSRMSFYENIADAINKTQGRSVHVEITHLPVPKDLSEPGWHSEDFDRVSVAYGLSLSGKGETTLGEIVRAIDVPNIGLAEIVQPDIFFVSNDQM